MLIDKRQTFWDLAVIQLSGWTSLPILATSILILQGNSFLGAALTIVVGNALMWFIRFGIMSMSYKKRQSTLDVSREYLGSIGTYCVALILIFSTISWFITQTTVASTTLTHLVSFNENPAVDQFTQMSVFLGVISTFLCMEGIVALKKFAKVTFPIVLLVFIIAFFSLPKHVPQLGKAELSLSGLTLVLSTNLGLTSDLPTFFRHSKSWIESIKALIIVQLISIILGIVSLYFASVIDITSGEILSNFPYERHHFRIALITFVFFSVIGANAASVYTASVGWEVLAPRAFIGRKEYLILGLGLSTLFILASSSLHTNTLLNITDISLVNLCMVLILAYAIRKTSNRPIAVFDQLTYLIAWFLATSVNVWQIYGSPTFTISPVAIAAIIIAGTIFLQISFKKTVMRFLTKKN